MQAIDAVLAALGLLLFMYCIWCLTRTRENRSLFKALAAISLAGPVQSFGPAVGAPQGVTLGIAALLLVAAVVFLVQQSREARNAANR